MEEKLQKEEGISLLDIFHLLLSKLKLLILVVIIGGIFGGAFAVWRTIDINYHGTEIQFYVNPDKKETSEGGSQFGVYGAYGRHVMDNMVKLLSSESFTEQLILNTKPVPDIRDKWSITTKSGTESVTTTAELNGLIAVAQTAIEETDKQRSEYLTEQDKAKELLKTLQEVWVEEVMQTETAFWSFSELAYQQLVKNNAASSALVAAYTAYDNARNAAEVELADYEVALADSDAKTAATLNKWRETDQYKYNLSMFSGKVSYSYLGETDDFDDANNLARSFIYIKISVLNDEDFAKTLRQRVIDVVPAYVEKHMAIPDGYEGTNCQRITRSDEIHLTNVHYTTKQAIKYGILFAAAAAVVTCVVLIINDRSDKRLRDQETITRLFNIPVLGIVPTINDLKEESIAKKKSAYVKPKMQTETAAQPAQEEAAIAVEAEQPETTVAVEPEQVIAPKKRRDTSNSPSNKKKAANKSKSEVK